jgi:hypothetical protein
MCAQAHNPSPSQQAFAVVAAVRRRAACFLLAAAPGFFSCCSWLPPVGWLLAAS